MAKPAFPAETDEIVTAEVVPADDDNSTSTFTTDVVAIIEGFNNPVAGFYSSVKGDDFETRMEITEALTSSEPLKSVINTPIELVNYIIQPVTIQDDETGEVTEAARIVLLTSDGKAYHATSNGLILSLRNIHAGLGEPSSWPKPVKIKVVEEGRAPRAYMTIKFVK